MYFNLLFFNNPSAASPSAKGDKDAANISIYAPSTPDKRHN